ALMTYACAVAPTLHATASFHLPFWQRQPESGRLLIKPDHVACRVAEPCGNLGRVRADGLHDFATARDHCVQGCGHAIDHDVEEIPGRGGGRAPEDPGAAYFAGRVVKGSGAISAFPDVPAEHPLVKVGRARNVSGGKLDVADLAVRKRGRHPHYSNRLPKKVRRPVILRSRKRS